MQTHALGKLEVHRGDVRYEVALRPGALVIGRDARLGLCLNDVSVSRRHAVLIASRQGVLLHDLGGRNGVTRNGVKVASRGKVALGPGDRLRIGETELVYAAHAPAQPARAARALVAPRRAARPASRAIAAAVAPGVPAPGVPALARPAPWWAAPAIGAVAVCALLVALASAGLALVAVLLLLLGRAPLGEPAATGAPAAAAGTPAAGTPAAGTPAAGTPAAGTPAAGLPAPIESARAAAAAGTAPFAAGASAPALPALALATPPVDAPASPKSAADLTSTTVTEVARAPLPSEPVAPDPAPAAALPPTAKPAATPQAELPAPTPLDDAALERLVQRLLGRAPAAEDVTALREADAPARRRWFLAQEALVARAWAAEVEHQGLPVPGGDDPTLAAARAQDPLTALGALVSGRRWARRHLGAQATARAVFERLLSGPGRPGAVGPEWWAAVRACEGEEVELLGGHARSARELLRLALARPEARQALQARMAARALGRTPGPIELEELAAAIEREQAWFGPLVDLALAAAVGSTGATPSEESGS